MNTKQAEELLRKINKAFTSSVFQTDKNGEIETQIIEFYWENLLSRTSVEEGEILFKNITLHFDSIPRGRNLLKLLKVNLPRKDQTPIALNRGEVEAKLTEPTTGEKMVDYAFKPHWKPETKAYITLMHLLHFGYLEMPNGYVFPTLLRLLKGQLVDLVGNENEVNLPAVAAMLDLESVQNRGGGES